MASSIASRFMTCRIPFETHKRERAGRLHVQAPGPFAFHIRGHPCRIAQKADFIVVSIDHPLDAILSEYHLLIRTAAWRTLGANRTIRLHVIDGTRRMNRPLTEPCQDEGA